MISPGQAVRALAVSVTLALVAGRAPALSVGYYDMSVGAGNASQVAPITAAGHTPVRILSLSAAELAAVDILFVQNPSNGAYGAEYLSRLAIIESAVANGLILIIHDRWVDQAETILPGGTGFDAQRSFSDANNIDVRDASTRVTDGIGGTIVSTCDANVVTCLDGGNFSSHGFALASSLPPSAKLILSRTQGVAPNEDWIVTFSYTFGDGAVIYSSIPLDLFLASGATTQPSVTFRTIYAPNVIDYAALLALRIPDLAVTVDDGQAEAVPGETVTYEAVVSNLGPGEAPDATVAIDFSSLLTAVLWTCLPSGTATCTASGSGDIDDTVTLGAGETLTYVAVGSINPGATGSLTTTASVVNPVGDDPAPTSNSDADTDTLRPVADVSVAKAGPARADSGQPAAFTITVHNAGPSDATGVQIFDPTPHGLALVAATAPCAMAFPCDLGSLAAGASASFDVTYSVPVHAGSEPIVNRASVTADPDDPRGANNLATSTIAVNEVAMADLALTVTGPPSAAAGSTVTYRLRAENLGPHDAQNATLTHTPPAGLAFLTASAPCAGGLPCLLGTVNAGATRTVDVTFGIPGGFAGSLLYAATVSSSTTDPMLGNDGGSAGPVLGAGAVDLVLTKRGPAVAALGDDMTYTLTVTNHGPGIATGVMLEDMDPAGLVFVAATAPCAGGLSPPCDLGTLAVGESIEVAATWNLPSDYIGANPIVNTAMVSAAEAESFTEDDVATTLTGIGLEATDLRVDKAGPAETAAGAPLTYTLTVTNAGPGSARSVVLNDTPPGGLVPGAATAPCDMAPFFPCDLGDLAPGETVIVGVTFAIAADHAFPNPLTNAASVTSDNVDAEPSNGTSDATTTVVAKADLSVTKDDGLIATAIDQVITYTMVVTNLGPSDVLGAAVDDLFPAQLGAPSWCRAAGAGSACTPDTAGDIADSVDIAAGDSVTYTARATVVAAAGTLSNTVLVAPPAEVADPVAANDSATDDDTVIVPAPDLAITKTGPTEAVPGTQLVYALTVTNGGAGVAESVALLDPTPAGLAFVSATAPCLGAPPCDLGDLQPAAVVAITLTYQVPADYAGAEPIVNIAEVTTTSPDGNLGVKRVEVETPVVRKADLDITKVNGVDSPDQLVPGEAVTYTIQVRNLGPSDALGAHVVDTLPAAPMAELLAVTWNCLAGGGAACGDAAGSGAIDQLVDLPAGGSLTYVLDAVVDPAAVTDVANTVAVMRPAGVIDPVAGNNTATDTDGVQPVADLSITKSNGQIALVPGEPVRYTLVVSNAGPSDVSGARVTDDPPAGLLDVQWDCTATGDAACGAPTGSGAIDELVDLAAGGEVTFALTARVDPAAIGTLDNTAAVEAPPIVVVDPEPANDSATDSDPLTRLAGLRIAKLGPGVATPGTTLVFTLTAGNDGPSDATLVVTDPAPPGLGPAVVVETTLPPPPAPRCTDGFPCLLDLAAGEAADFTVTYDVPVGYAGADPIVNRAAISGAGDPLVPGDDVADPDPSDNVATSAVPVARPAVADLGLTKLAPAVAGIGSTVTYRLTVTNHGPDDAPGVVLVESPPAGLDFESATAPCSSGFDCALGIVTAGATVVIEATYRIPPGYVGPTLLANTASVTTAADDPDPANDSDDSLTTLVADPFDLAVEKSGPLVAVAGSDVTYHLLVRNRGPAAATNTRLDDPAPPGLTFAAATAPCGGGFPCFLDRVEADQTLTVDATFTIAAGYAGPDPIANTASVVADPSGAFSENNSATWFTGLSGAAADLAMTASGPATVAAGGAIHQVLVVRNLGPGPAIDVMLDDPAAAGTAFAVASAPCEGGFPCPLGDLPVGSAVVVQATFAVPSSLASGTLLTNTATVAASSPDPHPANDTAQTSTTVAVEADLAVTKSNGLLEVVPGTAVTYTVTVTNLGPSDAPGTQVDDVFAPLLSGVTWTCIASAGSSCSGGAAGSGDIARSVDIAAGGSVTYTATGLLDPGAIAALANTATATPPAGLPDPDPANNQATDIDPVAPRADLAITNTDGSDTAVPGLPLTYTITVRNLGPSDAPAADVTDSFPPSLGSSVMWSCTGSGGATCGAGGALEILDTAGLPAGSMVVYTATGTVAPGATGSLVNLAAVSPSSETSPLVIDPNAGNNASSDTDTLTPRADIALTKDDGADTAAAGAPVVYAIVVTNLGPSDAPSVSVTDTFQAPVTAADWTCSAAGGGDCLAAAGGGSGNIGITVGLPAGGSVTLSVTAAIDPAATGLLVNTATAAVPPTVSDPVPENNTDTDTDTLTREADLAVTKVNGASTVVVGTDVTYTITVTNNGPSNTTGASVIDTIPAVLADAVWTCTAGASASCTASGSGNIDDSVALPAGGSVRYSLTATLSPAAGASLTNTATALVGAGATDPVASNNSGIDTDLVRREADLAVSLRALPDPLPVDGKITFIVTAENLGPSPAAASRATLALPAALPFAAAASCTHNAGLVTCLLGDLESTGTAEVEISAAAAAAGTWGATAAVASATADPNGANDTVSEETTVLPAASFIFADGFESGDLSAWSAIQPPPAASPVTGDGDKESPRQLP